MVLCNQTEESGKLKIGEILNIFHEIGQVHHRNQARRVGGLVCVGWMEEEGGSCRLGEVKPLVVGDSV